MKRVLIVEDEEGLLEGLSHNFKYEGYEVLLAKTGQEGLRMALKQKPDLVVLDIMLPEKDGFTVLKELRQRHRDIPVLVMTARNFEADVVKGFDLGADDYVTKPFSVRELLARIRALLRRAQPPKALPDELRFAEVVIDFRSYEARNQGQPLEMTRKEFQILRLLASRLGEVVTRDELLNEVWGYENYPTTRTVDNHIASLRAKIERDPAQPRHLRTVHGVGYKLVSQF